MSASDPSEPSTGARGKVKAFVRQSMAAAPEEPGAAVKRTVESTDPTEVAEAADAVGAGPESANREAVAVGLGSGLLAYLLGVRRGDSRVRRAVGAALVGGVAGDGYRRLRRRSGGRSDEPTDGDVASADLNADREGERSEAELEEMGTQDVQERTPDPGRMAVDEEIVEELDDEATGGESDLSDQSEGPEESGTGDENEVDEGAEAGDGSEPGEGDGSEQEQ